MPISDFEIIKSVFVAEDSGCSDNIDLAEKLIELECPLPGIIFLKNPELTKLMIEAGCPMNDCLPESGETALHLAVELSDIENVKVLVDHGADLNAVNSKGFTPLHAFQMRPHDADEKLDILRLLIDRGVSLGNEPAFTRRILSTGDIRTLRVLIPYLDLHPNHENGVYPLHDLAENRHADEIVDLLQDKSFDVNARDDDGYISLDIAVVYSHVRMVQFLLENGADPNNTDEEDCTALSFILVQTFREPEKARKIVELLLQHGADAQYLREDDISIFDTSVEDNFVLLQPVLAHLAMIESFGVILHEAIRNEIEDSQNYKNYFESCKRQIELMKQTTIYDSVTLYSLLSECEEAIVKFLRCQEFMENYELYVKNNKNDIDPYYVSTIRLRFDKILELVQMKEKVAGIICEVMNLPCNKVDVIGHEIVKYLQQQDLENIVQL